MPAYKTGYIVHSERLVDDQGVAALSRARCFVRATSRPNTVADVLYLLNRLFLAREEAMLGILRQAATALGDGNPPGAGRVRVAFSSLGALDRSARSSERRVCAKYHRAHLACEDSDCTSDVACSFRGLPEGDGGEGGVTGSICSGSEVCAMYVEMCESAAIRGVCEGRAKEWSTGGWVPEWSV